MLGARAHGPADLKGNILTSETTGGDFVNIQKAPRLRIDGLGDLLGSEAGFQFSRKPFFWNTLFLGEPSATYNIFGPGAIKAEPKPDNVINFAELLHRRDK